MTTAKDNAASVRSTISRKKLAANRRNARKSTGPRSDAGKRVSSRNALTHAIFCRDLLVEGESAEELMTLIDGIERALVPRDEVECEFVDSIVAARWQLRRLRAAGRHVHGEAIARGRAWAVEQLVGFDEVTERACDCARRSERESLRQRRTAARAELERAATMPAPIGQTIAQELSTWERLSRYEQRLEQNIARSMRELRLHRKELREFGRPEPIDDDNGKAQNEPTEAEPVASDDTAESCDDVPSSMGVSPMHSVEREDTGGTPMLLKAEETDATATREASD